jgi:hypothetical protein
MSDLLPLTHALVRRIAEDEASDARITFDEIIGRRAGAVYAEARLKAWRRIRDATGCSFEALAKMWGCDTTWVRRAMNAATAAENAPPEIKNARPNIKPVSPQRQREILAAWAEQQATFARSDDRRHP